MCTIFHAVQNLMKKLKDGQERAGVLDPIMDELRERDATLRPVPSALVTALAELASPHKPKPKAPASAPPSACGDIGALECGA